MQIAVINESKGEEQRVAITPKVVAQLGLLGFSVKIEHLAGAACGFSDADYQTAGAEISKDALAAISSAAIVVTIDSNALSPLPASIYREDRIFIGNFNAMARSPSPWLRQAKNRASIIISLDLLPRITRAQAMDLLSSQANLAGYVSVITAAEYLPNSLAMMMTAAGTIPPARVLVMGAGVAGLQAIATAKRLGANVAASDVRPETMEHVQSLGAKFVAVMDDEFNAARQQVYAKPMSAAYQARQRQLITDILPKQDIVITTALVPGRPAPRLIDDEQLAVMRPGSVIADLAAATGGNCSLTKPGEIYQHNGVTIIGYNNWPARVAQSASMMLAGNYYSFIKLITAKSSPKPSGSQSSAATIVFPTDDEIIPAVCLNHPNNSFGLTAPSNRTTTNHQQSTGETSDQPQAVGK